MELNKEFIESFNKNKNKDEYRNIFNSYFHDCEKCRVCNDVVYYYDSTFRISKKTRQIEFRNKSCKTSKKLEKEYYLSVCEDCLSRKFPEYQLKNKSRVFNQMNYLTEYAFNINHDDAMKWTREKYAITENNLMKKWGSEKGKIKWKEYCDKQSISNTFEYKKEKYGWSKEKFDEYNKSRSVTIQNLIERHGEEKGLIIWKDYCDKQKYSTSLSYFTNKYGIEKGMEIYENFCKKRLCGVGYSEVSKKLFDKLSENFINSQLFYGENEWYFYDKNNKKYYLLDFYIKNVNIGIEFQGDIWHANPKKYKAEDSFVFKRDLTAKDIWDKDKIKFDFLRTKLKKLIIIWEFDLYKDGIDLTIEKILKEINE